MARASSGFRAFAAEHGVTNVANFLGWTMTAKLQAGQLAPNHPHIARIAEVLKCDASELAQFCKGRQLAESQVSRLTKRLAAGKGRGPRGSGTAVVLHPTKSEAALAKRALAKRGRGAPGQRRNSLKRQTHDLRSAVRGMLTTTNFAVLKGDRYVANMPTQALYLVLTDYAERLGIKTAVVLDPSFADLFD